MIRIFAVMLAGLMVLSACTTDTPRVGPNGKPLPKAFHIGASQRNKIPFRVLDGVNALRKAAGLVEVQLSSKLNAAAATHSRDMSVQNRPWHFGSDGSSPIERVARTGYEGVMLGENISETFEGDVETLGAWMTEADTQGVIMNPDARFMGIAWFQEPNGKIWWTQIFGS